MKQMLFVVFGTLLATFAGCGSRGGNTATQTISGAPVMERTDRPKQYTYKVKAVYPHTPTAYTQGLIWQDSVLIEGTGGYGESRLRRVELKSGKPTQELRLPGEFFGEGIAQLDDKIYQLTWQEGKVFVYDAKSFKKLKEFNINGEGWGLTTDGEKLYLCDGSEHIFVMNPETFSTEKTITVSTGSNRVTQLNELEWIEGEIWANVYMSDFIVRINPESGKVNGVINLDGILPVSDRTSQTDVLNGIAYDSIAKRVFVTGKNWNKLFEIEVIEQ